MNNGCICCTVRGDLIKILYKLLQRSDPLDAIIIETTGLADPAPVAQTFFVDEYLQVCKTGQGHLSGLADQSKTQILHILLLHCRPRQDWMVLSQSSMQSIFFSI
jgi:hypothetical protein